MKRYSSGYVLISLNSLIGWITIIFSIIGGIIIVVNACTDNTLDIACAEAKLNSHIKVIQESNLGHSNARNKGWQSSQASFVFYLDDDAKPNANLLTILNSYLKNKNMNQDSPEIRKEEQAADLIDIN